MLFIHMVINIPMPEPVKAGVGVIIVQGDKILLLKRKGSHAPVWAIPGGHIEPGETFEQAATREMQEELAITIHNPQVIALTNNLETFRKEGRHYLSVILLAQSFSGTPIIQEPDYCEALLWADPKSLPEPFFDASRMGIDCWLSGIFYKKFE